MKRNTFVVVSAIALSIVLVEFLTSTLFLNEKVLADSAKATLRTHTDNGGPTTGKPTPNQVPTEITFIAADLERRQAAPDSVRSTTTIAQALAFIDATDAALRPLAMGVDPAVTLVGLPQGAPARPRKTSSAQSFPARPSIVSSGASLSDGDDCDSTELPALA
jgi:hypothetical protein